MIFGEEAVIFLSILAAIFVVAVILLPFSVLRATGMIKEIRDSTLRIENIQRHRMLYGNKPEQSKPASRNKQRSRPPPGGWPQGDGVMAQRPPHEPTQST